MRDIGVRAGRPTVCELTAMDSPLGAAVGNALEVAESCEMLAGGGPGDFRELVLGSAARMAVLSDLDVDLEAGRRLAERAVSSGEALRALERLLEAQGGDPRLAERPWDVLEPAPVVVEVRAPRSGSVSRCGALAIGRAAMRLGAGRERKEDPIDHAVGIVVHAKPGDAVAAGDALAHVHARAAAAAEAAAAEVLAAYAFADAAVERPPLLLGTVG
jgi:thymidine phosphorylase